MIDLTVLIPARNAAATIERAVRSARAQQPARMLVIDHASSDGTIAIARGAGGERLDVLTAPASATLGAVRQVGLDAVRTAFGMWLDADDELLPGRGERLLRRLEADEADLAYDEIDLHDGATGELRCHLPIPALLGEGRQIVREFERNYLPGLGVPAFRTAAAQALGFDPALHGAEDYDFLLRAIVAGRRTVLVREVGYRQFVYPASLSRDLERQRAMVRQALYRHAPADVYARFRRAGYNERTSIWGMVAFLTQRGDYEEALQWVARAPHGSRCDFHRGTLLAAMGRYDEAFDPLRRALDDCASPELLNNFGVVLSALERKAEATEMFVDALVHLPGYRDADVNLRAEAPVRLTLLPLREHAVRSDY